MTGFLEAADRFDASAGTPFGAFAYRRVGGAMIDGVRRSARVPRRAHERLLREAAMVAALEQDDAARTDDGAPGTVAGAERTASGQVDRAALAATLDEMLSQVAAAYVATAIEQRAGRADPEEELITEDEIAKVRRALDALDGRDARVVRGIFFEDRRQEDLAAELGVERSTISKMSTRALAKLRDELG